MKKRKKQSLQQSEPEIKPFSYWNWLNQPIFIHSRYQHYGNMFGYGISMVWIVLVSMFIFTGYVNSPKMLDDQVMDKILDDRVVKSLSPSNYQEVTSPDHVLFLTNQTKIYADNDGRHVGIYFITENNSYTGLLIPMEYINIPEGVEEISVSYDYYYVGEPVVGWGFLPTANSNQTKILREEFQFNESVTSTFTSTPTMATKDRFNVSWDQAKYLIFALNSNIKTETVITKIMVLGK